MQELDPMVRFFFSQYIKTHDSQEFLEGIEILGIDLTIQSNVNKLFSSAVQQNLDDATISFLLEHGADINHIIGADRTALHWAAFSDDRDLAVCLLNNGINKDLVDIEGLKAEDLAADPILRDLIHNSNVPLAGAHNHDGE